MKVNRNENESQNGRTIYLYDHAVIKEFSEPITFDTVATAYELLEAEIAQCQALALELLKSKAEVQYWKHQLGKQKQMVRSLSNQW
jgi:predicted Zn-dependent protease